MRKSLALVVACCAMAVTPFALAQTQGNPSTQAPACEPAGPLLQKHDWRKAHPLKGHNVCPGQNMKKLKRSFFMYRAYRKVTPYRCGRGPFSYWAIPCYIIECESHFSWSAHNSSGASGPYQLLGWGAPYPARTFRQKLANHRIAHSLSLSNWVCA